MTSQSKQHFLGIDLGRGIAAYAVVQVHSGDETWGVPIDPLAIKFRLLFYFAVPFFLATSFYFSSLKIQNLNSLTFWKSKIERVIFPYITWTLLYLVFRFSFFNTTHEVEKLKNLVSDPLSVIFFGGASYQLYFLPLLFVGTFWLILGKYIENRKVGLLPLFLIFIFSIFIYEAIVASGNDFQLGENIAFEGLSHFLSVDLSQNHLVRIILVEIAWATRCLAYMIASLILKHYFNLKLFCQNQNLVSLFFCFVVFCFFDYLNAFTALKGFNGICIAYSFFLLSLLMSKYLKENKIIKNLGYCSFGIYLIHPFFMNIVKVIFKFINPNLLNHVSIYSMLSLCISTFLLSWLATSYLAKKQFIAKYLFGI